MRAIQGQRSLRPFPAQFIQFDYCLLSQVFGIVLRGEKCSTVDLSSKFDPQENAVSKIVSIWGNVAGDFLPRPSP